MWSGDLNYWLLWGLGPLLFLGCMAVTWWGLFGDRGRGQRRCPRCWYDLSGTVGLTCSECGHVAAHERGLHRIRRRILPALAAALVASGGASYVIEQGKQGGWVTLLPARILLGALPWFGRPHGHLISELETRVARGQLSDHQLEALVSRCLSGDRWARPVSAAWESKYSPLLSRCRGTAPIAPALETAMLKLPARIELTSRRAWPADAPMCLELELREWWPAGTQCRLHLTPRWGGASTVTVRREASDFPARRGLRSRPFPLVLEAPPVSGRLEFDVVLERLLPEDDAPWEQVQAETLACDVEVAGSLAEALRPERGEALQQAVMATFSHGVTKWASGRSPVRVSFDPGATYQLGSPGTAIGAAVEILRDGTIARRLDIWWPLTQGDAGTAWVVAYEDEATLREANGDDGLWQMRVRGEPALALRAGSASSYWEGEFTIPLVVHENGGEAPPRPWRRENP